MNNYKMQNIEDGITFGENTVIGNNVIFGKNVTIRCNCIIEDNVILGDNVYVDSNTIIRRDVAIGKNSFIGSNCLIGEYWMDYCLENQRGNRNAYFSHPLTIGENSLIRSGSIIYGGSEIGNCFQTGHQVTIREKARIGDFVSVGTLSDIQGDCKIGNYVRLHSNVHVAQLTKIDDFVWLFPYVVFTNDPTPPSDNFVGTHVHSFSIIATGAIIMPGLEIGQDALVAAGAIVTKSVEPYSVSAGNPAKTISDVRKIKNKITGEPVYPWRNYFKSYMPWQESDFNTWYSSLDLEIKRHHKIEFIIE